MGIKKNWIFPLICFNRYFKDKWYVFYNLLFNLIIMYYKYKVFYILIRQFINNYVKYDFINIITDSFSLIINKIFYGKHVKKYEM